MKNKATKTQRLSRDDSRERDLMVLVIDALNTLDFKRADTLIMRRRKNWDYSLMGRCFRISTEQIYYIKKLEKVKRDLDR